MAVLPCECYKAVIFLFGFKATLIYSDGMSFGGFLGLTLVILSSVLISPIQAEASPRPSRSMRLPDLVLGPEMDFLTKEEAAAEALQTKTLTILDAVAASLLASFPPETHDFLSLGTSPALLVEVMKSLAESEGREIAITSFPLSLSQQLLSPQHITQIHQHFETWLPEQMRKSTRPLVILDFVSTGKTLKNFASLLPELRNQQIMDRPIKIAGLMGARTLDTRMRLQSSILEGSQGLIRQEDILIVTLSRRLYTLFQLRAFKAFAAFQSWSPNPALAYEAPASIADSEASDRGLLSPRVYNRRDMHRKLAEIYGQGHDCEKILTGTN